MDSIEADYAAAITELEESRSREQNLMEGRSYQRSEPGPGSQRNLQNGRLADAGPPIYGVVQCFSRGHCKKIQKSKPALASRSWRLLRRVCVVSEGAPDTK